MRLRLLPCVLAACAILPEMVHAGTFIKADNTTALNLPASWNNNAVPGAADVAQWDSSLASVNNTTNLLGANTSWGGIVVLNPVGAVTITTNTSGNTLTLGGLGIDMSSASADLIMSNGVTLPDYSMQTWNVPAGRTLSLQGPFTRTGGAVMTFNDAGTINIAGGTASTPLYYSLINNATDVGALDASKNVSTVAAVKTYTSPAAGGGSTATFNDVVNASSGTTDDVYLNTSIDYFNVIRFNTPQPNRSYWSWNAYRGQTELGTGTDTILVTTNVGACDVIFRASGSGGISMGWRQTGACELIVDQENTAGSIYFYNGFSQKNALAGNTLTKRGAGRAIFNTALVHTGPTRILQGEMMVNAGTLSTSIFNINSGATLSGIGTIYGFATNNGTIWAGTNGLGVLTISNLTMNAGSSLKFYSPVVPITNTAPLLVLTNVVVSGPVSVSIGAGKGVLGQYPLIVSKAGAFSGAAFANFTLAALPPRTLGYLSNNTAAMTIDLVVTNVAEPLSWATGSATWNTNGGNIWQDPQGNATSYQETYGEGDSVLFADALSGASPITVTLNNTLVPAATTFSNSSKSYTLSGAGGIAGVGSFTKSGSGTLVLGTANAFTGGLNLNGGILNFNALTNLGGGPITFGGGTLQYNGNSDDISAAVVTLGAGGGTIDTAGQVVTYNGPIGNNGAGGLTKTGSGTLTLSDTNRYAGNTIINQGTLALNGNSYISNSAAIIVNSGAVLDTASSGVGLVLDGGQILAGSGTVNGEITVPAGATVSPGTNGVFNTLTFGNDLTFSGGTYACDVSSSSSDLLVVNGNLTLNSGTILTISAGTLPNGVYKIIQYSGSLLSGPGSSANLVITGFSQAGKVATLSDANPGEIDLVIVTQGGAVKVWQGDGGNNFWDVETTSDWTNSSGSAAQFVQGDVTIFNDSTPNTSVNLQAAVQPGSVTVNGTQSYTFLTSGTGRISGSGSLTNNSTGTLTISTSDNGSGQTVINAGTVQVGNGGVGDIGSGNVINNSALVFDQSAGTLHTVEQISGPGTVTQEGSDTVVFDQNNTFSGGTLINGGTLQVGANAGATGSLGTGPVTNNAVLVINRSGSYALNNAISGAGTIGFAGSGTVTLGGANSYVNNTYITNGTVKLGASEVIPDANSVPGSTGWLVLDGGTTAGTFDLNGFNETVNSLSGLAGTVNGLVTNSAASSTATNTLTVLENAATTYNGLIADNASSSKVRLVVLGNTELELAGNNTYSGGTQVGVGSTIGVKAGGAIGVSTITLSNTATLNLHSSGSSSAFVNNLISIPDNSAGQFNSSSQGNGISGSVVGGPTATNTIIGLVSASAANLQQYNGFFGTVVVNASEALRFSASSGLNNGGTNTMFDVEGNLFARNGGTITLGALEGAGSIGAPSVLGTSTYVIGSKNVDTVFSGTINNALPSTNNAVTKTGTGKLTLSGTLSYLGNTTVQSGTLALVDPAVLDNSPTITLSSNTAAIDVTGRSDTSLNLGNISPQVLAGHGNIYGSLNEAATTTNNLTLGTLNVSGTATISGALNLQINRTNTPNCSQLAASTFVNSGSIVLIVSNVGPTNLVAGDKFQLFSKAFPGTFVTTNLPALPSSQLYWTNYIPVDGSLVVASLVNTTPTNITFSVTGNTLSLSWPADHLGWYLQAQTNSVGAGLGSNWVDVAGSSSVTSESFTINPANPSVFYRMSLTP